MIRILFLVSLCMIWVAVLHGLAMALAGTLFARRSSSRAAGPSLPAGDWPGVSLIVPAHDEEKVIERSLRRYLGVDYPRDRLQVVLIDDGSTDRTGEIADQVAASDDRLTVLHVPPEEGGHGKATVLNRALPLCRHQLIGVYDADNRPRPDALRRLVADYAQNGHDAAVGRIIKVNRKKTLLNRLSSLDFSAFQWTFQAGRAFLFDVVLLPGTNYVIHADLVRELGGWDPNSLTEDLELSVRLYCSGHRVSFVPTAVSEEEDPERVRIWIRQRTRWLIGNYYVLLKRSGLMFRSRRARGYVVLWELFLFYFWFLAAVLVSQAIFFAGLAGVWETGVGGPLLALWGLAIATYAGTIQLTQALEQEATWRTPFFAIALYFVLGPLWLLVFVRGLLTYVVQRGHVEWAKTPRTGA